MRMLQVVRLICISTRCFHWQQRSAKRQHLRILVSPLCILAMFCMGSVMSWQHRGSIFSIQAQPAIAVA